MPCPSCSVAILQGSLPEFCTIYIKARASISPWKYPFTLTKRIHARTSLHFEAAASSNGLLESSQNVNDTYLPLDRTILKSQSFAEDHVADRQREGLSPTLVAEKIPPDPRISSFMEPDVQLCSDMGKSFPLTCLGMRQQFRRFDTTLELPDYGSGNVALTSRRSCIGGPALQKWSGGSTKPRQEPHAFADNLLTPRKINTISQGKKQRPSLITQANHPNLTSRPGTRNTSLKQGPDGKLGDRKKDVKNSYQEHPQREIWQIQKSALTNKFGNQGWKPRKRLSPDALEGIRALHAQYPGRYTTPVLADQFKVSPEAIRRILKSKWRPNEEEEAKRRKRWDTRGEGIWSKMVEIGIKPPKKWREMGIGKTFRRSQASKKVKVDTDGSVEIPLRESSHRGSRSALRATDPDDLFLSDRIL
ncbi:MAG: hypothetical protein Q9187_000185 [Circinaria calcarea]